MKTTSYVAWSTPNYETCGPVILALGSGKRATIEELGRAKLPKGEDFMADKWRKNFVVESENKFIRRVGKRRYTTMLLQQLQQWLDEDNAATER